MNKDVNTVSTFNSLSSYDNDTDLEIANQLEKLNIRLIRAGLLHAGDDAIMIQAHKRLRKELII